jgi:hypothetical protein
MGGNDMISVWPVYSLPNRLMAPKKIRKLFSGSKIDDSKVEHYFDRVLGFQKHNADGASRQQLIQRCKTGDQLQLKFNENNSGHHEAIWVCNSMGQALGFLAERMVPDILMKSKSGFHYAAYVAGTLWGNNKISEFVVVIVEAKPSATSANMVRYLPSIDLRGSRPRLDGKNLKNIFVLAILIFIFAYFLSVSGV